MVARSGSWVAVRNSLCVPVTRMCAVPPDEPSSRTAIFVGSMALRKYAGNSSPRPSWATRRPAGAGAVGRPGSGGGGAAEGGVAAARPLALHEKGAAPVGDPPVAHFADRARAADEVGARLHLP